jgi:hypothetical protein
VAHSHTKGIDILSSRDDAKVLIDLLLIAQNACMQLADELSQCGAMSGASVLLALASRAYDMCERLKEGVDDDNDLGK